MVPRWNVKLIRHSWRLFDRPEYNFPGNCYSEDLLGNPGMLQSMARANGMIGAAEPLLWPAERTRAEVGIVSGNGSEDISFDHLSLAHFSVLCMAPSVRARATCPTLAMPVLAGC